MVFNSYRCFNELLRVFSVTRKRFFQLPIYENQEKAINALCELVQELPAIYLPHQDGVISFSAFTNDTTSKLTSLLPHSPFNAER